MIVKSTASVLGQRTEAIIHWLEQVGFGSFAYRLAHLPISRQLMLWTFAGLFVFV
ncbi:hypothetical protein [Maritalea sp.]|uniref:hypothetical protein n=1 Tax=Maritalea sp. TaxID=2003361 RepID=UPI003EF6499D